MTQKLRIAFYGEGNTDKRVMPIFVEKIIFEIALDAIDVIVNTQIWNGRGDFIDVCISLVRQSKPEHQMIVFHFDADGSDDATVRRMKIDPLLKALRDNNLLNDPPIVWAVPVHAIEAWLLASPQAFARALTTNPNQAQELRFPDRPDQIHRDRAKELFSEGVYKLLAKTQRQRRRIQPSHYHEDVAEAIRLDDLRRLPAFAAFEQDLVRVLVELGYVEQS
ncbi:MAG: hypothetical protein OHK0022_48130 [Roseiflexaceae bacterium]